MTGKALNIKFDSNMMSFLSQKSKELGYHHKMNKELPDYSATVRRMIEILQKYDKAGVSLLELESKVE